MSTAISLVLAISLAGLTVWAFIRSLKDERKLCVYEGELHQREMDFDDLLMQIRRGNQTRVDSILAKYQDDLVFLNAASSARSLAAKLRFARKPENPVFGLHDQEGVATVTSRADKRKSRSSQSLMTEPTSSRSSR